MRIFLATDHAGFELKEKVKHWLKERGYDVHDEGAFQFNSDDDYPDFVKVAARQVSANPLEDKAIIFGGSGQGEAIIANRYRGVRAVVYYDNNPEIVTLSRQHNDANILSLGARFISESDAIEAIQIWLETEFSSDPRHQRRLDKIDDLITEENEF